MAEELEGFCAEPPLLEPGEPPPPLPLPERPAIAVGWGHEMAVTTFIAAAIARVPRIVFCVRTVNPTYGWVPMTWARMLLRAHKNMLPHVSLVAVNSTLLRDVLLI